MREASGLEGAVRHYISWLVSALISAACVSSVPIVMKVKRDPFLGAVAKLPKSDY